MLNETHDPALISWVRSANDPSSDFPLQNLPLAIWRPQQSQQAFRGGVAIGDQILDLAALASLGVVQGKAEEALQACRGPSLNPLMAQGASAWSALRQALSRLLREGATGELQLRPLLHPQTAAEFDLPAVIGDFTDFYTSIHHATRVGRLFRPDNPLLPNYRWVPIAYHGRSSSICISGTPVVRPQGQLMSSENNTPQLGSSQRLDFELELGLFIGPGNRLGTPIPLDEAGEHLFGLCLLNDWSARDIQAWEYQPLGPFLGKSFATTLSPWVVTLEALAPFRTLWQRRPDDVQPLPYLDSAANRTSGALDIQLEVSLQSPAMRSAGIAPQQLSQTNFVHAYWTLAQMVAHHSVNGCNLRPGDLLGTGTQSGPSAESAGSLLELSQGGQAPLRLISGENRCFVENGDRVYLRGWCESPHARRIGFGTAIAEVVPSHEQTRPA